MIQKDTKYWDFNTLLGENEGEAILCMNDIIIHPLFRDDYQYSNTEIKNTLISSDRIGLTERIVVERSADGYSLIGPLLPYLAYVAAGIDNIPCIIRSGDLPQVQQVLAIRLNAQYSTLSPLVYSRLITRLGRLFPIMKAVSGMRLGIKREWIANILEISPSAVLRYSYISKVPEPLQLRCADPGFPYLCYKEALSFNDQQFHQLLEELIHYELRSRYITISSSDLSSIIRRIADNDHYDMDDIDTASSATDSANVGVPASDSYRALYNPMVDNFYRNLCEHYEERFDADVEAGVSSDLFRIAHKNGYLVPDDALQDAAYLLYSLSKSHLAGGQKLLDYACLRSILESTNQLYATLVL